ncbi:MAG TPA: glycosyltransferase family 4 protein [Streptosporangiaceae bacterium]|nr:glycosyltransferase family 4 protein [Streptosporangiaceae bacterium]
MSSNHLRITHVVRAKPPGELGGAESHLFDLATAQLAAGHDVRVVLLGPAQIGGTLSERVPTVGTESMSMAAWLWKLGIELQANRPDVLHSHGYRADLIAASLRLLGSGAPRWVSAMTAHGFIRTSLELQMLTRLNERALRWADVVIAVSSAEARRLAALLRRPVDFVPNGVARVEQVPRVQARAALNSDPARRAVAFVGRLSAEKRPDLFVDMAAIVAREQPGTDFLVIGAGPLLERIKQRAAAVDANVMFMGLVPNAASYMSAIDVLVCPSDTEGTPRTVIEAILVGVPVVATRVGGLPDLIIDGQTGLLVEPGCPAPLAEAVVRLLRDPAAARKMSSQARSDAANRFSAQLMADGVTGAYRSHLASRLESSERRKTARVERVDRRLA